MTPLYVDAVGLSGPGMAAWQDGAEVVASRKPFRPDDIAPCPSELLPANERRRVSPTVRLALKVAEEALAQSSLDMDGICSVFATCDGDTEIIDSICRALTLPGRPVSPTQFHNSVHNAAVGYWSIATRSHAASNAISAFSYSAPMAFLEAAIQVTEEEIPVLLVTQEVAAPRAMLEACPAKQPFSAALLLAPVDYCAQPISTLRFTTAAKSVNWPEFPEGLRDNLADNPGAGLLPLLAAVAEHDAARSGNGRKMDAPVNLSFPLSEDLCLNIELTHFPPA